MRVKSRKPPAENLQHLGAGVTSLELVGGADDRVGDQVRQVAGDRRARGRGARPAWSRHWRRARARTPRGARPPPARRRGGGVRMHQRLTNSSAKPASGPECSVPATGCAGTKCTSAGRCGAMSADHRALTEPTSETIAPASRCGADLLRDRAAGADRDADDDEVGAVDRRGVGRRPPGRRCRARRTRRRVAAERAVATIARTTPCARAARAIDEPIRPTPISARRLKSGAHRSRRLLPHELGERLRPPAGSPPRCRRSCAAHSAGL